MNPPQTDPVRRSRVETWLKKNQLEALIAWRPEELIMLLGHQTHWGLTVCLYPATAKPILYLPELEPSDRLPQSVGIRKYPWGKLEAADPFATLALLIQEDIKTLGIENKKIFSQESFSQSSPTTSPAETPPFCERCTSEILRLSAANTEDLSLGYDTLFVSKTPLEVERIRLANQVAIAGVEALENEVIDGITEAQLAGKIESTIQDKMNTSTIFYARGYAMVQSGENTIYSGRFNRTTGRRIEKGDIVHLELATCVNGYWSDLTRTTCVGPMNTIQKEIHTLVDQAQIQAMSGILPGKTLGEIDQIARSKIDSHGYGGAFTHTTGHQVGFRYHDLGPALSPQSSELLEAGMVITVEPGIYSETLGFGIRKEENVLVTENGYENLSAHHV